MSTLPEHILNNEQLDEILTRPDEGLIEYIKQLDGDIMVLGSSGKIGPTLAGMAKRAVDKSGGKKKIIAVSRRPQQNLADAGIETVSCDLLNRDEVSTLPDAKNIIFMAGRKFGSTGTEWLTWAANTMVPYNVAERFQGSRIVVFSTGCVYELTHVSSGGSTEEDRPGPIGEYAQSSLGRERIFDYFAAEKSTPVVQIRLNYAVELRYGLLCDIATNVYKRDPIDLTTGFVNCIWQGDCCSQVLKSLALASCPSSILNVTGPETLSVRWIAEEFGKLFNKTPVFTGKENGFGYLNNAVKANTLFGNPSVPVGTIIPWIAHWIQSGGELFDKPTHYETQNGKY